jgi:hypothetical protein
MTVLRYFLPNKTTAQICLQCQKIMGQQSLSEFNGLHVNASKVLERNKAIKESTPVLWKNKCIISEKEENTKRRKRNEKSSSQKSFCCISKKEADAISLPEFSRERGIYDCMPYEDVMILHR